MGQTVDQHDLILVSDSGKFYLIKMSQMGNDHEPAGPVVPLDEALQTLPEQLRSYGVEVADIQDTGAVGGASCYLLNLQRLSGKGPSESKTSPGTASARSESAHHRPR
jgi:hypothetical protein